MYGPLFNPPLRTCKLRCAKWLLDAAAGPEYTAHGLECDIILVTGIFVQVQLSTDEQRAVNEERVQDPHLRVRQEMLVLWLLHCGMARQKAGEIAGLSRATVQRYVEAFREGARLEGLRRWGGNWRGERTGRISRRGSGDELKPRSDAAQAGETHVFFVERRHVATRGRDQVRTATTLPSSAFRSPCTHTRYRLETDAGLDNTLLPTCFPNCSARMDRCLQKAWAGQIAVLLAPLLLVALGR
jgi:hypothetical protein